MIAAVGRLLARVVLETAVVLLAIALVLVALSVVLTARTARRVVVASPDPLEELSRGLPALVDFWLRRKAK